MDKNIRRILVIESNQEIRSLLIDFIKDEGYEADSVEKGTYAFRKLMTNSFDLIITDIQLPGFSGFDILLGLKKIQPETPVVVITAFGDGEATSKAHERGANAFLEKPIQLKKLRELIHQMVSPKERTVEEVM
jgi:DNA-binding NtrC family response regulator